MRRTDLAPARSLILDKRYQEAHALCIAAVQEDREVDEALLLLGVIAADHDNHVKAIELYDRVLALRPGKASALAQKGRSLIALSRRGEAVAAADAAAGQVGEADSWTLDTIGVIYSRAGLHEKAIPFYERAVAAAPDMAERHYNLAVALQFAGRMDEAESAYRACLRLDPDDVRAMTGLVQVSRQSADDNLLEPLQSAYGRLETYGRPDKADRGLHLAHAIAKTYEDLGQAEKAMAAFGEGKAAKRAALDYDFSQDERLFDAAIRTAAFAGPEGGSSAQPIFIVGMPRTGTTLLDRVLSSHSQVTSAGELTDFALCLKRAARTPSRFVLDVETLEAAGRVDLAAVGEAYVRQVRETLQIEGRFVDKMPLNAFYAPLILKALPEARVICLRRSPLDAILSNYRQLFATTFAYYNYALSLEDTAKYYAGFDRMIGAFRAALPGERFTEVWYEDLVLELERETRRLLGFCELEFEPQCLSFHENAAPVATASSVQVRQPVYTGSIGRWRNVRDAMAPAISVLEAAGIEYERDPLAAQAEASR
ncbi:MAG: sulfotransferase [Henriciella sp.]|uniref:sulfotransferase family protein n=1 Tax=Henriciella sp. TaxID=1968823 RepID=UPI003C77C1C7